MQYLLIIQIGPVQEFIATARKSRDLWFGSWLLSELAKAAAHEIAIQNELESLIFPWTGSVDDLKVDSELNVGNKIVAVINKPPASFCQEVHASIQKRLRDIREQAYSGIASAYFLRDIAEKQVDDLLEFYWVAVPFENEQAYQKTRITAEQLLAARKATRDFQPVTWGSNAPKSSLDGQRESVIHEEIYPCRTATPEQRKEIAHKLYLQYRVNEGERLCGIGLLKRHGESKAESKAFFSTSHVAALPLIARLKASDSQAVETYMNALNNDCVDKPNDLQRI